MSAATKKPATKPATKKPATKKVSAKKVGKKSGRSHDELDAAVDRLLDDVRDLRAATAVLDGTATEAEARYAEEVAAALSALRLDISLARAALAARDAETTEPVGTALGEVASAASGWLGELAVQTRLAQMDVRDVADGYVARLDRVRAETTRAVELLATHLTGDVGETRKLALDALRRVRSALIGGEAA